MGILLQVAFQGTSYGTVMARRDEEGNFLVRELDVEDRVNYRIVTAPTIPADAIRSDSVVPRRPADMDYVQTSDDVLVDLSVFHPLCYISKLFVFSFQTKKGVEEVELILSYPRGYGDKIDRELELHKGNVAAVGANWIAEKILFLGKNELVIYEVVDIQVMSRDDMVTEIKLTLHSSSGAQASRQKRIMRSEDLCCKFILNDAMQEFFLGTMHEYTKKGHQL